jgi:2-iminobutanoate/2-iminopropanoate deaminase
MTKSVISAPGAPKAIGPYSVAIQSGDLVFVSGQIGLDPDTGRLVSETVEDQAAQAMRNVAAVLDAAGTTLDGVVKSTIFLTRMSDFAAVNTVYGGSFTGDFPARSTVAVAELPLGARVEIEVIARL